MCVGAIVNARVDAVVYGAAEPKFGAVRSLLDVNALALNHRFEASAGVLEDECRSLMVEFFRSRGARCPERAGPRALGDRALAVPGWTPCSAWAKMRVCPTRRGARVVESGGLENRCALTGTVGSNPTLSAMSGNERSGISPPERCESG